MDNKNVNVNMTDSGSKGKSDAEYEFLRQKSAERAKWAKAIEEVNSKLRQKNELLEKYRHDYAKLNQIEEALISMNVVIENSNYEANCMKDQFKIISDLFDEIKVPYANQIMDFDIYNSSINKLNNIADDYYAAIKSNGSTIDANKKICADKVRELKDEINYLETVVLPSYQANYNAYC